MTTNQRMELLAALQALRTLAPSGERIRVVSDSTYVVKCFVDKWWARGSATAGATPRSSRSRTSTCGSRSSSSSAPATWSGVWVKGHSGDRLNDLVDGMAVAAISRAEPCDDRGGAPAACGPLTLRSRCK